MLRLFAGFVALCIGAAAVNGGRHTLHFVLHPAYTYIDAARNIGRDIRREIAAHPGLSPLVLSRSGSDLSLMNGLPSIGEEFTTAALADQIAAYRPAWYATWNEVEDDKMDNFTPGFRLEKVSAYPVMDDPYRNLLILYRVVPVPGAPATVVRPPRRHSGGGILPSRMAPKASEVR